jgi:hypothetical protein
MGSEFATVGGADAPAPDPEVARHGRLVARLSHAYVLRSLQSAAAVHGGDILLAIVAASIIVANTAHLNNVADRDAPYSGLSEAPPDDVRRPVSINALSSSLGIPFETTRRYVNKLIAAGYCTRVRGGVIAPAEALTTPANEAFIVENYALVRDLMTDLAAAGVPIG